LLKKQSEQGTYFTAVT